MSREIILLRHAHAESPAGAQSDAERALSTRGIAEAREAGHWLQQRQLDAMTILCSPALRARQTLEHALGRDDAIIEPRIYEATAGDLDSLIDEHASAQRLLLVGHNPGFETFVALLATGQSGDFRGMPPGAIAWFEVEGEAEPGSGKLKAFWSP